MKPSKSSNRANLLRTRSMSDPAVLRNRVTFQPPKLEAGSQNESHTEVSPESVLAREVIPLLSATKIEVKFEAGSQNEYSNTSELSTSFHFQQGGSPIPISGSSHNLQFHHSLDIPPDRRLTSSMPRRSHQQSPETVSRKHDRSRADNEAGSAEEDGVKEYVLALPRAKKIVVPQLKEQIKELPKKIKLKNSKAWEVEMWEPGMDAGSQTEDKESLRSPKEASSISGPEHVTSPIQNNYKRGSPAKNLAKQQQQQFDDLFTTPLVIPVEPTIQEMKTLKKSNKDLKTTLPREFSPRSGKKEAKRTSLGHKNIPSAPKGIEKKRSFEIMPNLTLEAGSERDLSDQTRSGANNNVSTSNISNRLRYGRDFGTTAASIGNDSAPFELKFEAEIAYFQNNFDMKDVLLSSDTDGSKAISEGSSTAEGAASAAEGYFDIYHYLQNQNQTNSM
jgi:hypothetical protein